MSNKDEKGSLNLIGIFSVHAQRILSAAEEGLILHRTKNLKDSGRPVEEAVRELFNNRLPKSFCAIDGYCFDEDSKCTPEIDIIIADIDEMHRFGASGETGKYVPYTCARAIGEIKNSADDVEAALNQLSLRIDAWQEMRRATLQSTQYSGAHIERPAAFLFFAKSDSLNFQALENFYKDSAKNKPHYVVFLDRAQIVAPQSILVDTFNFDKLPVGFYDYRTSQKYVLCGAGNQDNRGIVLLWFYFALTAILNLSRGNKTSFMPFTNKAENIYQLSKIRELTS